jgi:hypothetical protein
MIYRAIRACWHKKRYYKPGMVFVPTNKDDKPPRHFVADQEFSIEAVEEAARAEKLKRIAVKAQKAGDDVATGPTGGNAKKP